MSPSLEARRDALRETLAALPGNREQLAWLVSEAQRKPPLPESSRIPSNRIDGCLANLWIVCEQRGGCCHFACDSDSLVVKAIASVLCELYDGMPPAEIIAFDPNSLGPLGITQHLTPNRRNALSRVVNRIRSFAAEPASG